MPTQWRAARSLEKRDLNMISNPWWANSMSSQYHAGAKKNQWDPRICKHQGSKQKGCDSTSTYRIRGQCWDTASGPGIQIFKRIVTIQRKT